MKTHSLRQGTPEWAAHRAQFWNASDAPAMMGVSPYKSRTELLHQLWSGLQGEVDEATQRRFDDGHRYEALARPLAEQIIGQELYPVVGSEGRLSASFDGLTLDESIAFEHKTLGNDLRAALAPSANGADLPAHYRIQMQQQCMVSGAERVLFMASKWDGDSLVEELHCWYDSDPDLAKQILVGWEQFEKDLAAYQPQAQEQPKVGRAPESLPALRIEVTGAVTASNLAEFKAHALAVLAGINRDLTTDQDFADADKAVKWCADVESRLAAAKEHALSQTESIDALFRALDEISAETRTVRLELDKLVTKRKAEVKEGIVRKARQDYEAHIEALKADTSGYWIALTPPDFAGAAKGKRTLSSLQDAVDTVLAQAKIQADASARSIRAALACINEESAGFEFLFADRAALIGKPAEDLRVLVRARIAEHQAAEAKRTEAAASITEAENKAPAQAPNPEPLRQFYSGGRSTAKKPTRPTDRAIIDVLALHYRVHETKVIEWLLAMDLTKASADLEKEPF